MSRNESERLLYRHSEYNELFIKMCQNTPYQNWGDEWHALSPGRLCRNSVHGSRTSPRTEYDMLKINQLAVHPEALEGRMANYDTASGGRGSG